MAGFAGVHSESPGWGVILTVECNTPGLFPPSPHLLRCHEVQSPAPAIGFHRAFMVSCVWYISQVVVCRTRPFMFALHDPTFSCSSLVYVVLSYVIDHDMEDESCLYIETFPIHRVRYLSVYATLHFRTNWDNHRYQVYVPYLSFHG